MDKSTEPEIAGTDAVKEWFGGWPGFHDGEVISIYLARKGKSVIRVYPYYPRKPAMVDFIFEDVTDLDLTGFSPQNVINDLEVETVVTQDRDRAKVYRVTLEPCYGVAGRIEAKSLRVELSPGKSSDGIS